MSKDYFRGLAVVVGVIISGFHLSRFFVMQTTLFDVLMLCSAPIAAITLLPRKHWMRVAAFVFLFASVYGIGRIAAETGRSMLYDLPLPQTAERYVYELLLYAVYGSIWVVWWWRNRETSTRS